jgi:hypothetical protein
MRPISARLDVDQRRAGGSWTSQALLPKPQSSAPRRALSLGAYYGICLSMSIGAVSSPRVPLGRSNPETDPFGNLSLLSTVAVGTRSNSAVSIRMRSRCATRVGLSQSAARLGAGAHLELARRPWFKQLSVIGSDAPLPNDDKIATRLNVSGTTGNDDTA